MSLVLITSILLRLVGTVWAIVLTRRVRDGRMAFLAVMLALMTARQTFTLVQSVRASGTVLPLAPGPASEVPGLAVSVLSLVAVVFLARFLTEAHDRESDLRASASLLRSVIESAPEFVTACDLDGTFRWVNRTAQGVQESNVIGRKILDFIREPDREHVRACLERVAKHGETVSFEAEAMDEVAGGWFETRVAPIFERGIVTGMVVTARDVTERKRLEQMLQRTRRLDALGTLAGGVAHDFNNMLTSILGSAEAARRTLPSVADRETRERLDAALGRIRSASERASSLTRSLLAFGRREGGRTRVVPVNDHIRALEDLARGLAGEAVTLDLALAPDVPNVRIDPTHLEQILLNLLINARDASGGGGHITLATRFAALDAAYVERVPDAMPGGKVVVEVTDDGVGMDPSVLEHAFDPFFTTKAEGGGSGLGLATVYGLVSRAGGHVEVDSRAGEGSTFRVFLPAVAEAADVDTVTSEPGTSPVDATILLCEDETLVREVARESLEWRGFRVLAATGPEDALRIAEGTETAVDLLITDVVMPGMNGRQLAERIAADRPDLPVLFISGYAPDSIRLEDNAVRRHDFLAKPFAPSTLVTKVEELLRRRTGSASGGGVA